MSARPSPGPAARLKQPQPPVGIAAGAEDAKYQSKYRELKRKVKVIETDNDKLHFKVLQARRSIQRMKLERAILYERLAGITEQGPPVPVPPPFSRSQSANHPYPDVESSNLIPYDRPHLSSAYEVPPRPSVAHTPRPHSPPSRHVQHMPPPHANSRPHERTRSESSSRSCAPYIPAHPALAPVQHQAMHSHPIQDVERSRRHDHADPRHDYPREHERDLEHGRSHSRDFGRNRDGPNSTVVSPPMAHRGPPPYGRGGDFRLRDEPAYYAAPPSAYAPHSRSGSPVSRSGSGNANAGGSVGAGGDISRPDSRHYYEPHERSGTRAFKLRPVNPPNEEMDFVHEDGRSRDRGGGGGGFEMSRKRGRNEMDAEDDAVDYSTARVPEDRGIRYREHRRSIDNQDDGRMGLA